MSRWQPGEPYPTEPPCGMRDCYERATHVDSSGVGFCEEHSADAPFQTEPVSNGRTFDRWWRDSTIAFEVGGEYLKRWEALKWAYGVRPEPPALVCPTCGAAVQYGIGPYALHGDAVCERSTSASSMNLGPATCAWTGKIVRDPDGALRVVP